MIDRRPIPVVAVLAALTLTACGSSTTTHSTAAAPAPAAPSASTAPTGPATTATHAAPTTHRPAPRAHSAPHTASAAPAGSKHSAPVSAAQLAHTPGIIVPGSHTTSVKKFAPAFSAQKAAFSSFGQQVAALLAQAGSMSSGELIKTYTSLAGQAAKTEFQLNNLAVPLQYKPDVIGLANEFGQIGADLRQLAYDTRQHLALNTKSDTRRLVSDAATLRRTDDGLSAQLKLPAGA